MRIVGLLVGAFYVIGGYVVLRRVALERVLDLALQRVTQTPADANDRLRVRALAAGAALTFAGGLSLLTMSRYALHFFTISALWQAGYLVWAGRALRPEDAADARGRRATKHAFVIYVAAWLFVVLAYIGGVLHPWTLPASGVVTSVVELGTICCLTGIVALSTLRVRDTGRAIDKTEPIAGRERSRSGPLHLRISPEYQCWPLWDDETGENVSPDEAGLPKTLGERIKRWDDAFQATYRGDDPVRSGFEDPDAERWYLEEGKAIVEELRRVHLGPVTVR